MADPQSRARAVGAVLVWLACQPIERLLGCFREYGRILENRIWGLKGSEGPFGPTNSKTVNAISAVYVLINI